MTDLLCVLVVAATLAFSVTAFGIALILFAYPASFEVCLVRALSAASKND